MATRLATSTTAGKCPTLLCPRQHQHEKVCPQGYGVCPSYHTRTCVRAIYTLVCSVPADACPFDAVASSRFIHRGVLVLPTNREKMARNAPTSPAPDVPLTVRSLNLAQHHQTSPSPYGAPHQFQGNIYSSAQYGRPTNPSSQYSRTPTEFSSAQRQRQYSNTPTNQTASTSRTPSSAGRLPSAATESLAAESRAPARLPSESLAAESRTPAVLQSGSIFSPAPSNQSASASNATPSKIPLGSSAYSHQPVDPETPLQPKSKQQQPSDHDKARLRSKVVVRSENHRHTSMRTASACAPRARVHTIC
jgi:hypothetical protein